MTKEQFDRREEEKQIDSFTRKIKVDKTVYILEKLGFKWAPVGKKEFMSAYKKIKKLWHCAMTNIGTQMIINFQRDNFV